MVKAGTFIPTERFTKVLGKMINKLALEMKIGQMEHHMKASICTVKNMEKELLIFKILLFMKGNLKTMTFMVSENINGWTAEFTKAIGKEIKCMVQDRPFGQMAKCMLATMTKIKSTDRVPFNGLMEESI